MDGRSWREKYSGGFGAKSSLPGPRNEVWCRREGVVRAVTDIEKLGCDVSGIAMVRWKAT